MTYGYDDHTPIPARSKADRIRIWSIGATLAVVGVVSAVYLTDQYRAAAPWRAAQEAERLREREARAEEKARQEAIEAERIAAADAPLNPQPPVIGSAAPKFETMSQDELRRYLEEHGVSADAAPVPARTRTPRAEPSQPLEWAIRPQWPALRGYTFPEGVTRIRVDFGCAVSRTGVLSDCRATESPAGTGLGARMRPALAAARMQPMTRGGRPVDGEATISVSFDARPPAPVPVPPASPAVADRPRPPAEPAAPAPDTAGQNSNAPSSRTDAPSEPPAGG